MNEEILDAGMKKVLEILIERTFSDNDIKEMIDDITVEIMKDYHVISSYDRYEREIYSHKLTWGPTHTPEFWKENIKSIEKNCFELMKQYILLLHSNDEETVAVACYDLGEFVRFYPSGKSYIFIYYCYYSICKTTGIKTQVMELLSSPNPQIAKQALLSCSKMMINNWEHLESNENKNNE